MLRYLLVVLVALSVANVSETPVAQLELLVQNVRANHGKLWIGIYPSAAAFLDKQQAHLVEVDVRQTATQRVVVEGLAYGEYAVALFHDLNDNDELDFNWMGIPAEPFAFSRPVTSKWRLPEFDEVKIELTSGYQRVRTDLRTWWD
ncbi:MAG: DUF2141 domain-containing protein [Bacteroidota bacterium]